MHVARTMHRRVSYIYLGRVIYSSNIYALYTVVNIYTENSVMFRFLWDEGYELSIEFRILHPIHERVYIYIYIVSVVSTIHTYECPPEQLYIVGSADLTTFTIWKIKTRSL